jgi:superfamily I DNA/RNA helicase
MTTERFSLKDFEQALEPHPWTYEGLVSGEHVYRIVLDNSDLAQIQVRSSIDSSGVAASTGEDSIRAWLVETKTGKPIGSKVSKWVTRVPGWQDRLNETIEILKEWWSLSGACPDCGKPKGIFKVKKEGKNKGRVFSKCQFHNHFQWLDETPKPKAPVDLMDNLEILEEEETRAQAKISPPQNTRRDFRSSGSISLNEYQQAIVDALANGPQVIEACPGSGKTRTLENLIAALIDNGVSPSRIGAFTFSRKAAEEMRWRIARTLWPDCSEDELQFFANPYNEEVIGKFDQNWINADPARKFLIDWVCTIHALAYRMLKARGEKLRVLSGRQEREVNDLIRDTIKELDWSEGVKPVRKWIATAIRNLVEPSKAYEFYAQALAQAHGPVWCAEYLTTCYQRYMQFMKSKNLVDFDMMQARVVYRLRNEPAFKKWAQAQFDYILVDEAQDTSYQQAEILWTLAERTGNIVFCGDVDQSMYAFRGAHPDVLRGSFESKWKLDQGFEIQQFNLPINYRSTQAIVKQSAALIKNNYLVDETYLKPFQWKPDAPGGTDIEINRHFQFESLATDIANEILNSEKPGDWYVLSRTRAECSAIHTALVAAGVPAINKSGGMLFGAPHIRKVLAYAQLAANYQGARDNLEILKEIANVATSGFTAPMTRRRHLEGCYNDKPWVNCGCPIVYEKDVDYSHARFYGQKAIDAAGNWAGVVGQMSERNRGGFPTVRSNGAHDLVTFVRRLEQYTEDARMVLNTIIHDCVLPWLMAEEGIVADEDLAENGKAEEFDLLLGMVEPGMSTEQFLEKIDMLSQGSTHGDESESVLLGTCHWSKGSERPRVIVNATRMPIVPPQPKEGQLPTGRPPTIEEERRLLFVAITRAQIECQVFVSEEWNGQMLPVSPFLMELKP